MSAGDLHYLSAVDAVGLFRRGELSPRELMEAVIARAEQVEPTVNAFTDTFFEEALHAASVAADAYARGANRPLEGLALAVKDEVHVEGQRATEGSLLFADQVAAGTDPFAQRLIDAGAIVHARTTTPEFSMAAVTWSLLHGVTRNPWNPDLTCGGSSGGSGASLAAGSCTLATGSDIAGSIRIPSSLNGLVGFKPPWGRVPEVWPWNREWYAASGPMARTVGDSALFENAMAGPLEADMFSLQPYRLPELVPPGRGMRVAVSGDLGYFDVSTEVADTLSDAVAVLAGAGIECEPVELGWTREAQATTVTHLNFVSRSLLTSVLPEGGSDRLTPYIRAWFEDSPEVTVRQWWESWEYADQMYAEMQAKVVHDDLSCCQALLSVDDRPSLDLSRRRRLLLEYDSSHEVGAGTLLGQRIVAISLGKFLQVALSSVPDVIPQRLPLVLLVPHVGALEDRDDVANILLEQRLQRQRVCLHGGVL